MPNRIKEPHAQDPRKLESGRWQARVTYYDPDTGKRRETSQTFATEREAKKWSREQEIEYREDPNRKPPSEQTLGEFLQQWLDFKGTMNIATKTLSSYREMAAHSIRELGTRPLKTLSPLEIQRCYVTLTDQRGLSPRTVSYAHTILKMALSDAVEWGLIPKNPAAKAKAPKRSRQLPLRIPTPDETIRLLEATEGSRWYPLWAWFSITGTRLGEALALQWTDIDWQSQTATIRRAVSGDAGSRVVKTPKTAHGSRTIALGERLLEILEELRHVQDTMREVAGSHWEETGLVFTTFKGKMLAKRYVDRVFKQALRKAELPDEIRVHDLRHGMATRWLSTGVNPNVVKDRLGHSSVAFTLQVYGHVLPHEEAAIAGQMEDAILEPSTRHPHERGERTTLNPKEETLETRKPSRRNHLRDSGK